MLYIHLHVSSWLVGIILFILSWALYSKDKVKVANITQNINRVVYLAILFSGIMLLYRYTQAPVWDDYSIEVMIKGIAGIYLIVLMEWFWSRYKAGAAYKGLIVQLVIVLAIVLILGFARLPWGFAP